MSVLSLLYTEFLDMEYLALPSREALWSKWRANTLNQNGWLFKVETLILNDIVCSVEVNSKITCDCTLRSGYRNRDESDTSALCLPFYIFSLNLTVIQISYNLCVMSWSYLGSIHRPFRFHQLCPGNPPSHLSATH